MTSPKTPPDERKAPAAASRARLWWEIGIVLAVTVGQSALYSVLSLVRASLRTTPIGQQQTQLNPDRDAEVLWNVLYQFLAIVFGLALVALVVYLLWEPGTNALRRIGLDFTRFGGDLGRGILLAAVIGVPGLGLYVLSRILGLNVAVVASPLDAAWWTVPLLVLAALRAGLTEEVIFIGYLFDRLRRVGWSWWTIILTTAALRGAYHAYQGIGAIVGNFVLGVVFGWCYRRWGRVMPLVIAHTLLDVVAFVGYPLAAALWPGVFAPAPTPTPSG
ncbi:CPBP family intramembrane metalloprotease [Microbacterium sp. zg.B48]|uniref:CPBP family intramembrane glutamic endopeptidase n=1 Tax=unclassified Microbacterium TaxID=2609290 RepID=UPI00214CED9A|nr:MULTISPECIES: CPBP family intramembrane glutamic endopeptidase [unclassified Microbacterium]MCR2762241.1 CPBP family intramembrane metalloprotease [Microbacterium sp. zg.B48]MCR2809752.1 CPBP family intramembrane metalloprotease [Microbacterium sp. zg.B185]WIM17936.1 CPBP family intramembrane metalloprotease [Microbacterium sp. zg-B185]